MICAIMTVAVSSSICTTLQCVEAEVQPTGAIGNDGFPSALALAGDRVIVGASRDDQVLPGGDSGAAYIFEKSSVYWLQSARLAPGALASDDLFGEFVAIDGLTAAVGAPTVSGITGPGSAYVFEKQGPVWVEVKRLAAADGAFGDMFGPIAVSGDVIVVGAPGADEIADAAGAAYVFEKISQDWIEVGKLLGGDGTAGDLLGASVGSSGQTIAVGAPWNQGSGAVYVFKKQGMSWIESSKILASDASPGAGFGTSVSLSGNLLVVGANGSAYVFREEGATWVQEAKLVQPGSDFGASVSASGETIAVGGAGGHVYKKLLFGWIRTAGFSCACDGLNSISVSGDLVFTQEQSSAVGITWNDFGVSLEACPSYISASLGGEQVLEIDAGQEHGGRFYILLGSMSGASPGFSIGGFHLPLNPDSYLRATLRGANNPPLINTFGQLDDQGRSLARFELPTGTDASLVGLSLTHSYAVFGVAPFGVQFTSNATSLEVVQ